MKVHRPRRGRDRLTLVSTRHSAPQFPLHPTDHDNTRITCRRHGSCSYFFVRKSEIPYLFLRRSKMDDKDRNPKGIGSHPVGTGLGAGGGAAAGAVVGGAVGGPVG